MIRDLNLDEQEIKEYLTSENKDDNPISITANILERNGFYLIMDTCRIDTYRYHKECIGIYIFMFSIPEITIIQRDSFLIKNLQIRYIHQLQYILYKCGMDDLANNFKF